MTFMPSDSAFAMAAAISFSLWRSIFLINEEKRNWAQIITHSSDALETVLAKNTFGFAQEKQHAHWIAGLYVYNAKFRLERRLL